jgi:PTH1 family peptidyl-tRNA hydrolase
MKAFVGLGNPGTNYLFTRHNVGFLFMDAIQKSYDLPPYTKKFQGEYLQGKIERHLIHILKPQTFMNLSGDSVLKLLSFYKLKPQDICVFHDDLDLAPGKIRLKKGGGAGGHNGLKDIDKKIGSDYWRLRIGIGRPVLPRQSPTSFVLSSFTEEEESWLIPLIEKTMTFLPLLFEEDPHKFTSKVFNI